MKWLDATARLARDNTGFVLITVLDTEGSAPRDAAAKMVLGGGESYDSIGGGQLEYQALDIAAQLLVAGRAVTECRPFSLGKDVAQCCGGRVVLLFECFPPCAFNVVLFGAGHVGRALASILSALPCRVAWLDSRRDTLTGARALLPEASNIHTTCIQNPVTAVENCPPGAYYLIMTHRHDDDFELCEAILSRRDSAYCGLIGSRSKAAKFRSRLRKKGFTETELASLTCPIGLPAIPGKAPMEVAVSVAGQLLALRHAAQPCTQPSAQPAPSTPT